MPERVGFIGLGIMGQGMAHNLLKTDFPLTVWNRTASKMEAVVVAGALYQPPDFDRSINTASRRDRIVPGVGCAAYDSWQADKPSLRDAHRNWTTHPGAKAPRLRCAVASRHMEEPLMSSP